MDGGFCSSQQRTIVNCMSINEDNVMVSAGLYFRALVGAVFCSIQNVSILTTVWTLIHFDLRLLCVSKITFPHSCTRECCPGDNGSLWFWDYKSGHNFQQAQTIVQPGILPPSPTCTISFKLNLHVTVWWAYIRGYYLYGGNHD